MPWLLDPNLAYTLLMLALLSITLAILVPGTGLLEIIALGLSVLSGYTLLNLPLRLWALLLLGAGLVSFVVPVWTRRRSGKLWLAFSFLALALGSAFLFAWPGRLIAVHPALVAGGVVLTGGYFWLGVHKGLLTLRERPIAHNLETLVGRIGETRTPVHHRGSVYVEGEMWSARSAVPIPPHRAVRVIGREGLTLLVEPLAEEENSSAPTP